MQTYITNYNSKNLVYKMDLNSINLDEEIYKIDFKWFNNFERIQILAFKLLYSKPEEFFKYYKKKDAPVDTKKLVFEALAPAFHYTKNCDRLNSDYLNFEIPEKIRIQRDLKIQEFRVWVKENMHLIDNALDLFLDRMKWKFGLSEKLKDFFHKNSGITIQQNLDLETLESKIQNLIQGAFDFYSRDEKNKSIIDHFGLNSSNNIKYQNFNSFPPLDFSFAEITQILNKFEQDYKSPLKNYLQEYYKVKYNPELEFKGELLEQVGFKPCQQCVNNYDHYSNGNKNPDKPVIMLSPKVTQEQFTIRVDRYPIGVDLVRNSFKPEFTRQTAQLKQLFRIYYPSGKIEESWRMAFMDVPLGTTIEQVEAKLKSFPDGVIYQVLSDRPILTDNQVNAIKAGLTTLDIISFGKDGNDGQAVRYGKSNNIPAGKGPQDFVPSPVGNIQYRQTYYSKDYRPDLDLRQIIPPKQS